MKEILIDSVVTYMRFLKTECGEEVIFRGQPQDKSLLPRIARKNLILRDEILDGEKRMFKEFKRRATPFLDFTPQTEWDWLALAQHYGLATRLLDWTKNSLAALWFAVRKPAHDDEKGVVWIFALNKNDYLDLEEKNDHPFDRVKTKVFQPNHIAKRLIAQDGWFTAHGFSKKQKKFIPFNENIYYKSRLVKLSIKAENFGGIREDLDVCGVNDVTLFPEMQGLCDYIVFAHSVLKDEEDMKGAFRRPKPPLSSL